MSDEQYEHFRQRRQVNWGTSLAPCVCRHPLNQHDQTSQACNLCLFCDQYRLAED